MATWETLTAGVIGVGVGEAAGAALEPIMEPQKQTAWNASRTKLLELGLVAELAAAGLIAPGEAHSEGNRQGFTNGRVDRAIQAALGTPSIAEAMELRRRGQISLAELHHVYAKERIEHGYWKALDNLLEVHLTPAQVALGIVRSVIADPGLMPVQLDVSGGRVPAYRVSPIPALEEAAHSGIDEERLRVMVGEIGLPMSVQQAASALFRGIIDRPDYNRAVIEGDTRPEWGDAILEQARQIPSVADYVALHLRGHTDAAGMHAGAARHGMSADDADRIYLARGRPAAPGQMATAAARGIAGPEGRPMDREQFLLGIAESDIRPEWGPMLWDSRFLYPSLFQLGRLVEGGAVSADTAAEWARKDRYPPEVVTALHTFWSATKPAAADPYVAKARTQLWNTTHRSYLAYEIDDPTATQYLEVVGVAAASIPDVLQTWRYERDLATKRLTPKQLASAWKGAVTNPATGAPWQYEEALEAIVRLGYSRNDAITFLEEQ